jgi:SPP1 gp7 family putative phage head morphogenesis protein
MFGFRRKKDWRESPAHLLLLSKFLDGVSPERFHDDERWAAVLGGRPAEAIDRLRKAGMLAPAELRDRIDARFKASELKPLLKQRGLKVSGRKEALIDRLIEHDEAAMRDATGDVVVFRCTEEGRQLAERYLEDERQKREAAERAALDRLQSRDLAGAARAVAGFEAGQVFSRGMGIDWSASPSESDKEILTAIFDRTPALLAGVDTQILRQLRLAAAMQQLWGTGSARKWLPDDCDTGMHLDADTAARMLVFHAFHLENVASYRRAGFETVEVSGVDDSRSCPQCRQIHGKIFALADAPEMPYAKCTCEMGCRCMVLCADFD